MTSVSRWGSFPTLLMLLLASLFLGACGGGGDNTPLTTTPASTQQIVAQLVQQGYLKASNTNADDVFGQNVALAGDTLVVGAYQERSSAVGVNGDQADNSQPNAGAVYVFTRTAGVWTQQAYLKASNTNAVDGFGYSVALSGDTLVVGAPWESSNATGVNGNQSDSTIVRLIAIDSRRIT